VAPPALDEFVECIDSRGRRRGHLPKTATGLLRAWLYSNVQRPYPTEQQKVELCELTGLSAVQVNNWFSNARRRILRKVPRNRKPQPERFLSDAEVLAEMTLRKTLLQHAKNGKYRNPHTLDDDVPIGLGSPEPTGGSTTSTMKKRDRRQPSETISMVKKRRMKSRKAKKRMTAAESATTPPAPILPAGSLWGIAMQSDV
jgi:Homeobox KN domain